MAVAIIHFILGLTHALLVVTLTITLRTLTSIPIQNRKNLSFLVTAKLFTLSAIESEQPNTYRRIWNHSDAYATAQYPSVQLICATTFSVPNWVLERPTKLSKTHPNPPFGHQILVFKQSSSLAAACSVTILILISAFSFFLN